MSVRPREGEGHSRVGCAAARCAGFASLLAIALVLARSAAAELPVYHVVDIGVVEGLPLVSANGINDAGIVVGSIGTEFVFRAPTDPETRAFYYTKADGMRLLDPLPGGTVSGALGINSAGVVVGTSNALSAPTGTTAVRWSTPTMPAILGEGGSAGETSRANAINAAGNAVGVVYTSPPLQSIRAVLWPAEGGVTDLSALIDTGDFSLAWDINDAGQVVFISWGVLEDHAFLWSDAAGVVELTGLEGAVRTRAVGINAAGAVVGRSGSHQWTHATRWVVPTEPEDLGTLADGTDSEATDINDDGTVVGAAGTADGETHAMIWTAADGMRDLNDVSDAEANGLTLLQATAINSSGQITGIADVAGSQRGFLATPVPETAAAWPALGALYFLRRRRA